MTMPEIKLNDIQKEVREINFRASDFLTQEQLDEIHESNAKGKRTSRFDVIDAYIAEILGRFGYGTYEAWKNGEIDEEKMVKYIEAERAREAQDRLALENIIVASVAGANNPTKNGQLPKSLRAAVKMLKSEENKAKGRR